MRILLFITFLACSFVHAQQPYYAGDEYKKMYFGPYLAGEMFDPQQGSNYVTIVHMWGVSEKLSSGANTQQNQSSSIGSKSADEMRQLANTYKKYRSKGLMVVGVFINTKDDKADYINAAQFALKNKVNYVNVDNATPPIKLETLPYTFVYDAGGKLSFHGPTALPEIKNAIDLLSNYPKHIIGDRDIRFFQSEASKMVVGSKLGSVYKKLASAADDKNEEKKSEADHLLIKLSVLYGRQKQEFVLYEKVAPEFFMDRSEAFIKDWDGYPQLEEFEKYIKSLKGDSSFNKLLKGSAYYEAARKTYLSLKAYGDKNFVDFDDPKVVKKNASNISRLKQYCAILQKDYSGTEYALWADSVLKVIK